MEIKSDLIIKGAVAFVLVFVLGKFLAELLRSLMGGLSDRFIHGKKEQNEDIDLVIKRKMNEMRMTQGSGANVNLNSAIQGPIPDQNASKQNNQTKLSPLEIYQKAFTQATKANDEKKIKEYKLALELFDHLQWGDGKHYKIIETMAKQNYDLPISINDISHNFKEMNAKNIFTFFDVQTPLGYTALTSLIGHKSALDQLVKKICDGESVELSLFKMTTLSPSNMSSLALQLALFLMSKRNVTPTTIDFKSDLDYFLGPSLVKKKLASTDKKFPLNAFIQIISSDQKTVKSTMEIQDHILGLTKFLTPLLPYPDLKKGDLEVARILLEVDEKDNFAKVKKNYKNLVSTRHPDKFQANQFPKEMTNIINENFLKIQDSFNMIKLNMGEDE